MGLKPKRFRDEGITSRIVMLTVSDNNEDVVKAISQELMVIYWKTLILMSQ